MRHTFKELLDINRIWKNEFDGVVSFVDTDLKKEYENMKSLDYIFPVSAFLGSFQKSNGATGIINNTLQKPLYKKYGWRLPSVEEVEGIFEFHSNTGKIDHFHNNIGIVFVPTNEFDENGNRIVVKVIQTNYGKIKRKYTPMLFTKEDMETLMFDMVIVC